MAGEQTMESAGVATKASESKRAETRFVRDSTTWLAYLTMTYLLFIESSLGPIMPSLRAQMGMSYTVASLHFSAPAFAGMMTGWFGDKLARRLGRRRTFWLGVLGIMGGALLLVTGQWIPMTIAGALLIGGFGALIAIVMQAYRGRVRQPSPQGDVRIQHGRQLRGSACRVRDRDFRAGWSRLAIRPGRRHHSGRRAPVSDAPRPDRRPHALPHPPARQGRVVANGVLGLLRDRGSERRDRMGLCVLGSRFPAPSRWIFNRALGDRDERVLHRDGLGALRWEPHRPSRPGDRRTGRRLRDRFNRLHALLVGAAGTGVSRRVVPGRSRDRERLPVHRLARDRSGAGAGRRRDGETPLDRQPGDPALAFRAGRAWRRNWHPARFRRARSASLHRAWRDARIATSVRITVQLFGCDVIVELACQTIDRRRFN